MEAYYCYHYYFCFTLLLLFIIVINIKYVFFFNIKIYVIYFFVFDFSLPPVNIVVINPLTPCIFKKDGGYRNNNYIGFNLFFIGHTL